MISMLIILSLAICIPKYAITTGGYVGTDHNNTTPPVWAFISTMQSHGHPYNQYYYANVYMYDYLNDSYTDSVNFAFTCAHGNTWSYVVNDGTVYLQNIGWWLIDRGWGTSSANWATLYSCYVVASPIEKPSDWHSPWILNNPWDVMDGIHLVTGFRTPAYISPAVDVSREFAHRISNGYEIRSSWFDMIWTYGWASFMPYDKGCAVYYPNSGTDTIYSYSSDPPENHGNLSITWHVDL